MEKIKRTVDGVFFNFLIPLVFTLGFISVLLTLAGFDVKESYGKYLRGIPLASTIFSEKKEVVKAAEAGAQSEEKNSNQAPETGKSVESSEELEKVKDELALKKKDLNELQLKYEELQRELMLLKTSYENNLKETESKKASQDEIYKELSKLYTEMSPKKAAVILESLEVKEAVLLLNQMTAVQQSELLSRMSPEKASEMTSLLKEEKLERVQANES